MPATVADWIIYAGLRGTTVAAGTEADQALVRASDYIRTRYLLRTGTSADDVAAVEATYIAAGFEITTPGFWSTTFTPSQTKVLTKVDSIEWTPVSDKNSSSMSGSDMMLPVSPAIDALLLTGATWGQPAVMTV